MVDKKFDRSTSIIGFSTIVAHGVTLYLNDKTLFYDSVLFWVLFGAALLLTSFVLYRYGKKEKLFDDIFVDTITPQEKRRTLAWLYPLLFLMVVWCSGNVLNLIVLGTNYITATEIEAPQTFEISQVNLVQKSRSQQKKTTFIISNGKRKKKVQVDEKYYERLKKTNEIQVYTHKGIFGYSVIDNYKIKE